MAAPVHFRNMTWRVNEASKRVAANHEIQRAIIHNQNRRQLQIERSVIQSRIYKMPMGVRKVFLASRLENLKKQLN